MDTLGTKIFVLISESVLFFRGRRIPYSQKIWRGIKFGSLAVWVETTKLKSANIIFARTHNNNACSSALGSTQRPSMRAAHIASSALAHCQLYFLCKSVNSRLCSSTSNERTVTLHDKHTHVICCEEPPPNLNSANIFYARVWANHQILRLPIFSAIRYVK